MKMKWILMVALLGAFSAQAKQKNVLMILVDDLQPEFGTYGADYVVSPNLDKLASPIKTMDLASDTAWILRVDGGPKRSIKVPGGGWNSDYQSPKIPTMSVKDHVMYERELTVPKISEGQVTVLDFGGVNHGAEVFVDGTSVATHHGPEVAFKMDISKFVVPGKSHRLQVKALHRAHYAIEGNKKSCSVPVGWDFPADEEHWAPRWSGNSKVGYGIINDINLEVYPAVYIKDVFVRPSVSNEELTVWLWVRNSTDKTVRTSVQATLSSWNKMCWNYPEIAGKEVTIQPRTSVRVVLDSVAWTLGEKSYWWPNIPFDEDYRTVLHNLNLSLAVDDNVVNEHRQRFGFVEWGEGPYYYTVNGVRVNQISDSTAEGGLSYWNAYSTAPAYLPPNKETGRLGCPETWERFMRIGINMNRLHCSIPTKYMMETADELGYMLMPESPIWGNRLHDYNPEVTPQVVQAMARFCRNHPCIARYSLTNEIRPEDLQKSPWVNLIDAIREADDTRPLSYDVHKLGKGRIIGNEGGHAFIMEHYIPVVEHDKTEIRGLGESCWKKDGLLDAAYTLREIRMKDWAYFSPWCWMNYWPNFLEGMNHDLHAWHPQNAPDRQDGVNGWGSPIVKFVQKSMHPYLVMDHGIRAKHRRAEKRKVGDGAYSWPKVTDSYGPGNEVHRKIEVFNGGLTDAGFNLKWSAHWDQQGRKFFASGVTKPVNIKAGFHATSDIRFRMPAEIGSERQEFYLTIESVRDGRTVFTEDQLRFGILSKEAAESSAVFVREDRQTQGDYEQVYGKNGFLIVGDETERLPSYVKLKWTNGSMHQWAKTTDDSRGLSVFRNDGVGQKARIAACRYDKSSLKFVVDTGNTTQQMSMYFLDWDEKDREIEVELRAGGNVNQKRLKNFQGGVYQSWEIQGNVEVQLKSHGTKAVVSGIFFDPVQLTQ